MVCISLSRYYTDNLLKYSAKYITFVIPTATGVCILCYCVCVLSAEAVYSSKFHRFKSFLFVTHAKML